MQWRVLIHLNLLGNKKGKVLISYFKLICVIVDVGHFLTLLNGYVLEEVFVK